MARLAMETATAICAALGLDAADLASLDIVLMPGQPPVLKIVRYVADRETTSLVQLLKQYKLVPLEEPHAEET